jgi:DUF1680 family protein
MKIFTLLLIMAATITSAIAQKELDRTEMGIERVARLFTEVYQSPKADSDMETRWVQIDLGESKKIDEVVLYPRVAVYDAIVSEGFPERFRIEASNDPDFKTITLIVDKSRGFTDPLDLVCRFKVDESLNGPIVKRYVRITAIRLRQEHLAFTKVDILSDGKNIAMGCNVSDSETGDLGKNVLTRAARPNGEGVVTDNPDNVIIEAQWKPVKYKAKTPLSGVALKDGVLSNTVDNNIDYLMSTFTFNELTRNFRVKAGKEVEPFNEDLSRQWMYNLPGSEAGRFLMGAGNTLRWKEDAALRQRLNAIVDVIDDCKEDDGYMMAYRKNDVFTSENGAYVRSWVTHGLLDAGYAGNEKAFKLVRGFYDWFNKSEYLSELLRRSGQGPQGVIPITRTYTSPIGKSEDIYTVQRYFQENYFMEGMAARNKSIIWRYPYDRPHNYLLTAIEPYFDLYIATGDEKYLDAVKGGWDLYKENWIHVGASVAINEGVKLYPPQSYYLTTQKSGELCGSVFWAKINQRFHLLNPEEEKYVNEIEQCIYNVAIANQKGKDGIRYFCRLAEQKDQIHGPYVHKMNSCCEGQGTRFYGSLPEYIYSLAEDGVYVNLFEASHIHHKTKSGELELDMETKFPYNNRVDITVKSQKSLKSKIRVRIPAWVEENVSIRVNGKKTATGTPGTYVTLSRTWKNSDKISFELPMEFKTKVYKGLEEEYNDGLHYIVQYGPILLAAVNEKDPQRKVDIAIPESKLEKSLKPIDGKLLHFSIKGESDVVFRPYFELQDELFTCYPKFEK